ncbi:MAG TPA: hypothetical protein VLG15_15105, partial [Thermoanaerobaculia bacterium]|nr:hypothetical protein [Thermoanaerobaculia bacterium]
MKVEDLPGLRLRTPISLVFALFLSATAFGAESWRLTSPALYEVGVAAIAVDPRTPSTIYVGGHTGPTLRQTAALLRSDDGGFTWRRFGIPGLSVQSLNLDPANPDVVYIGTYGGGFLKSVDRGESWTAFQPSGLPWVSAAVLDRANPGTLYVAFAGAGIFRSTNSGETWTSISGPLGVIEEVVTSLALDPSAPNRLLAVAAGGLYRTDDGGTTWVLLSRVVDQILLAVPGALYGGRDVGLVMSTDGGHTWSPIGAGLPPPGNASFRALIQDPANPGVLYIGTAAAGVFRSMDGGRTWTPFNQGMTHRFVGALLATPSGDPFLYAGTDAGLYDYRSRPEFQTTLPAVASLHGVPPAFFHSDVWIFNGSAESEATVTATYRCLGGS